MNHRAHEEHEVKKFGQLYPFSLYQGKIINTLLKNKKQVTLDEAVLKANQEEAQDQAYHEELAVWDETLTDGLTYSTQPASFRRLVELS